jgi:transposase
VSGANVHDVKLLEGTLDAIVVRRPRTKQRRRQHLCLDKGYTGKPTQQHGAKRRYIIHVKSRGAERVMKKKKPHYRARRWVVERTHGWLNRFRKLLVRFEKLARSYIGLLQLACSVICFRQTIFING